MSNILKGLTEGLADDFAAFAKSKGHNVTSRGGVEQQKADRDAMIAKRNNSEVEKLNPEQIKYYQDQLAKAKQGYDPNYDYSDDHTYWSEQDEKSKIISKISKVLRDNGVDLDEAKEPEFGSEWDEKIDRLKQKAQQSDKLKQKGKEPKTKWNPETRKYYVDFSDDDEVDEGVLGFLTKKPQQKAVKPDAYADRLEIARRQRGIANPYFTVLLNKYNSGERLSDHEKRDLGRWIATQPGNFRVKQELEKYAEQGVEEGLSRRDFLKRGAIGAGLAATGYGAYKFNKWDTEQEEKFMSLIKDPADLEMYKRLRSEANMYLSLSGGSKDSTYRTLALAKAAEADEFRFKLAKKYNIDLNWIGNVKDKTVDEADKHSMLGKIQRGHELKKKVDTSFTDIGKAQQAGDHPAASKAFRKHERYANLERPGTWTKGVAEGLSKQFEIIYLDQNGERKRKIVSGTSKEAVARQFKKQYKLEIEQVKQLHQGVAEGENQEYTVRVVDSANKTYTVKVTAPSEEGAKHKAVVQVRNEYGVRPEGVRIIGQGVAEDSLNEFAVSGDGGGDDDSLFNYAKMWYNGDLKTQRLVEKSLQKAGLDIGENEDENGGAYISDLSGDYYESWTAEDLEQGVAEGEGDSEGLPHLTKTLLKHIVQQVGTEGAHAIVKSLEWGDGAAKELLRLITKDLKNNISIEESVKQRLDPKCWKGKHKEGTKIKGGVRVNNCVPNESKSNIMKGLLK